MNQPAQVSRAEILRRLRTVRQLYAEHEAAEEGYTTIGGMRVKRSTPDPNEVKATWQRFNRAAKGVLPPGTEVSAEMLDYVTDLVEGRSANSMGAALRAWRRHEQEVEHREGRLRLQEQQLAEQRRLHDLALGESMERIFRDHF